MKSKKNIRIYDLEERTVRFAENVIELVKLVKITPYNKRIIEQLVGCSGSIGANYCEANEAESLKDFIHKNKIAKKEIKESKHWLRLFAKAEPKTKNSVKILWAEAHELLLIFSSIIKNSKIKKLSEN